MIFIDSVMFGHDGASLLVDDCFTVYSYILRCFEILPDYEITDDGSKQFRR